MPLGYWVYMLRCADDTLYTGLTTDVQRRIQTHNQGAAAARYTRARRPVTLVWQSEALPDRSAATRLERRIKALSRAQKLALIAATKPAPTGTGPD